MGISPMPSRMEATTMDQMVSDELWAAFEPLVPKHRKSPKGGRLPADDRRRLEGLVYVLRTGCPWHLFPKAEFGVGQSTVYNRFAVWAGAGVFGGCHRSPLNAPGLAGLIDPSAAVIDAASYRAVFGGTHAGPSPVDRAENGVKHHALSDARGTPLLAETTPANVRDLAPAVRLVESLPAVKRPCGRPRRKPKGTARGAADTGFRG